MLPLERAYLIEKERLADFTDQAALARMGIELRRAAHPGVRLHQRGLIRLGEWMMSWGFRLRSRYESIPTAVLEDYRPRSANAC